MARLLVIEDDAAIRGALLRSLRDRGHAVAAADTAMGGLQAALEHDPHLIVLDLGLPDLDGWELLKMLRAVKPVPIIVATARDDDAEIVRSLDAGADDYVVKPFTTDQIDARIRAVLRRSGSAPQGGPVVLTVGGLQIEPAKRRACLDGRTLALTPREFEMLALLASRAGQVVSKRDLLTEVWQIPYGGADKTVDVHLSWLRRKLGETAREPRYLHTVRRVGVLLDAPPDA